jgi:nucleotide-binding universal stress UspA family protein
MTVLVAVDFSPVTERTLDAVRRCSKAGGLRIVVLHVTEPDPAFVGWDAGPPEVRDQIASSLRREKHQVEEIAAALRAEGLDAIGLAVQGPTVATILSEASRVGADLVAVGSHGHGAAYDLTVGSTSAGVIRAATVPVLVAPDRAGVHGR